MRKLLGGNIVPLSESPIDLSALTTTGFGFAFLLNEDFQEVIDFGVYHIVAGVGAATITYDLEVGTTPVSAVSAGLANTSADVAVSEVLGNGLQNTLLLVGTRLRLKATFSVAVTSGPKIGIYANMRR